MRIGNKWDILLKDEYEKSYYKKLEKKIDEEYKNYTIYPKREDIFACFRTSEINDVKVIILGQDPYHGEGQAHGYSFSVNNDIKIPPSLRNIYKELNEDLGFKISNNGNLLDWAKQGVLLLNTSLTVRAGKANSHKNIGWEIFTDKIIETLGNSDNPIVFILWGGNARKKKKLIKGENHLIIENVHPSPLSSYRGFFGSKPFSKTNYFLEKNNLSPINWEIKDIR